MDGILMLLLYAQFIFSTHSINSDVPYNKTFVNIGRVGYYAEIIREVPRIIPEVRSEGFIPIEKIPKYGIDARLNEEEKKLVLKESEYITTTLIKTEKGSYNAMDKDGNLYLNQDRLYYENGQPRRLYKHYGAIKNYQGDVSDSEPAVVKRITAIPKGDCYQVSGLYAPAGELIAIRIREKDLESVGKLIISIGQVLNNGKANNIWTAREFIRMPVLTNTFELDKTVNTSTRIGTDYVFYVGSFIGGPIYFKTSARPSVYTFTVVGAVRYTHYIHGYTTPEDFAENWKSSAPFFDFDLWQSGIQFSGPRQRIGYVSTFEEMYETGVYWEKATSVSNQIPCSGYATDSISMLMDPFVAAGAAVAFSGQGSTNCPLSWFQYVLGFRRYLMTGDGDIWGPHHEYHHHFQNNWGLSDDGETSNNAVTLITYSLFTKISQRRTEDHEPDGDGWNAYTSGSWALRDVVNNFHSYHLCMHAIFLHSFGQDMFIKAAQKRYGGSNDGWHRAWTELTELDMTYFFRNVYYNRTITDAEVNRFSENNYKSFVPIACLYQTGVGYMVKGKRNEIHTMRPFIIQYKNEKILNFTKNLIVPKDIDYTIKSISSPQYGQLKKVSNNIYSYTPDPEHLTSGQMIMTLGLTRRGVSNFPIDDVEVYIELQQSYALRDQFKNLPRLDKKIYYYPPESDLTDPVAAFNSNYEGSLGFVDIMNNNSIQNKNTEIWMKPEEYLPDRISELRGKFEVQPNKYRIALRGRKYCALFLSFDEGKTYELAANVVNEAFTDGFNTDENHTSNFHDYQISKTQWIYFKAVLSHTGTSGSKYPFVGLGIATITESNPNPSITYAEAVAEDYQPDPAFIPPPLYPRVWSQERVLKPDTKGTLLDYNYTPYNIGPERFNITNLFDDDDNNRIHSNEGNTHISASNPFMLLVDMGSEITANKLTFYRGNEANNDYLPKVFTVYGGNDLDDLKLIVSTSNPTISGSKAIVEFPSATFRYYQLNITETFLPPNHFLSYTHHEFSSSFKGKLVSIDDDSVSLYNKWSKQRRICNFGQLYIGEENSVAILRFTGNIIAINALKSSEFGSFRVIIDDGESQSVDLKGSDNLVRCVFKRDDLSEGDHTITVVGSSAFNIDSFMIKSSVAIKEIVDDGEVRTFSDEDNDWKWEWENSSSERKSPKSKSKGGLIAGVVIAVLAVIVIAIAVFIILKNRGTFDKKETTTSSLP